MNLGSWELQSYPILEMLTGAGKVCDCRKWSRMHEANIVRVPLMRLAGPSWQAKITLEAVHGHQLLGLVSYDVRK
jgi:hypothetical protein